MKSVSPPDAAQDLECRTQKISPPRLAGRARFAELLHKHLLAGHHGGRSLVVKFAAAWQVSRKTVYEWVSPLHLTAVVGAGDIEALAPEDRKPLLERWLEHTNEQLSPTPPATDPQYYVVSLAQAVGAAAATAATIVSPHSRGGIVVTSGEWGDVEAHGAAIEERGRQMKLAARAAADKQRGGPAR